MDNLETITYLSKPNTMATICNVLRRAVTKDQKFSAGAALFRADLAFHIWVAQIPPPLFVPKESDIITDADGSQWVVTKVEIATLQTRYKCYTEKLKA